MDTSLLDAPLVESRPAPVNSRPAPVDDGLKPSAMRGTEPLYGYVIALELIVVSILNLVITTGKGAPAHSQTGWMDLGLAAAVAVIGLIRTKNRMVVGFGVIIAAFLVTFPKVPNSLEAAHLFAIVIPIVYALVLTQRQRKLATAQIRAARSSSPSRSAAVPRSPSAPRSSGRGRTRTKASEPPPAGPRRSARYTPPKAKRGRR